LIIKPPFYSADFNRNLSALMFGMLCYLIGFGTKALATENTIFYLEDEPVYTSSDNQSPGFLMEVVMEMAKTIDVTPEIKFLPWKRAQEMAAHTPNAVIFPLSRIQSREKKYQWMCKIFDVPVMFINKKGNELVNTIKQAKKIRGIGVIIGTPQEAFLQQNDIPYVTVTGKHLYSKLANNHLTTIFTAKPEAISGWKKGRYSENLQFGQTLQTLPLWIATSKLSDQVDTDRWCAALKQVRDSGFFESKLVKYFGEEQGFNP